MRTLFRVLAGIIAALMIIVAIVDLRTIVTPVIMWARLPGFTLILGLGILCGWVAATGAGLTGMKGARAGAVVVRVLSGLVALFAMNMSLFYFVWTMGQNTLWMWLAVVAVVSGWLAVRGLPLTRAREERP